MSSSTLATTINPFDEDTFFTSWVTPGLVSGLIVAGIFVALVSVGVSWMLSIQTPKNLPSATSVSKQKKHRGYTHSRNGSNGSNGKEKSTTGWYWIPVGAGIGVIGVQRLIHIEFDISKDTKRDGRQIDGVAVSGPWQLHVLSALPLKAMSRLFGSFNEIEIPRMLRSPLLRLYAWIFG
ncbi:phosphatidylserine decarboxylase 1, partial [Coemansia sp. RSA 2049]